LLDFLKFFLPLAGAALAWFLNERRKRSAEEYERKEKKYSALIDALQGFYVATQPSKAQELKAQFLGELNKCWLYCPDDVIRKAYAFLATVHTGANSSGDAKERAVGEFIVAIRKDLLSRRSVRSTELTAQDFKHLRVN
jgi:hypothetical protein